MTSLPDAGGGHTADSELLRAYFKAIIDREWDDFHPELGDYTPQTPAEDAAIAAVARLEAAANRTAEAERVAGEYWAQLADAQSNKRAEAAEAERDAALARVGELEAQHVSVMQSIAAMNRERGAALAALRPFARNAIVMTGEAAHMTYGDGPVFQRVMLDENGEEMSWWFTIADVAAARAVLGGPQ